MTVIEHGFRAVSEDEAQMVFGGDFLVPSGPDSNSDPNAKFILIPAGLPNYDQDTINQQAYYTKYYDYQTNSLLTFGVNMNNNDTYVNTLELVTNKPGVGTRSNVAVVQTAIANILRFAFVVNDYPAPRFVYADFANGQASVLVTGLQYGWSMSATVSLTDNGNGTTTANITVVTHGVNG